MCVNNGTCIIATNGTMYCNCTEGFIGQYCEREQPQPTVPTTVNPCLNGGTLVNDEQCLCPPNYTGNFCEDIISDCPCLNGGTCTYIESIMVCECPNGWSGDRCQYCTHTACTPTPVAPLGEDNNGTNIELIIGKAYNH